MTTQKINSKKKIKKKKPGDIIILHMFTKNFGTKNFDHMMYGSWDMVRDRWTNRRTD